MCHQSTWPISPGWYDVRWKARAVRKAGRTLARCSFRMVIPPRYPSARRRSPDDRREGLAKAAIARRLSMSRNTVDRLLTLRGPPRYRRAHNGGTTTARYDGAQATIEVTNPGVRAGKDEFVASRILAKKDGAGSAWLEVGWAEIGWRDLVNGVPEQFVYTYDTAHNEWELYNSLCVSDGCHVDVRIIKGSTCDIGDPTCTWTAQLFNHSTGTWQNLHSVTLPQDRAYIEEMTEVYIDPDFPLTLEDHIAVDQVNNDLDWSDTQRRYVDSTWNVWRFVEHEYWPGLALLHRLDHELQSVRGAGRRLLTCSELRTRRPGNGPSTPACSWSSRWSSSPSRSRGRPRAATFRASVPSEPGQRQPGRRHPNHR